MINGEEKFTRISQLEINDFFNLSTIFSSQICINFSIFTFEIRKLYIYIYIFKERKACVDPYVRRVSVCILIGLTRRAR